MERLLSLDPAYDNYLSQFRQYRSGTYRTLERNFNIDVDMPNPSKVTRTELIKRCRATDSSRNHRQFYYTKLAFCTHGNSGEIYIKNSHGIKTPLLSIRDDDNYLQTIVQGRSLFFMACNVAQGHFLERMMDLGARDAVGFTMKPKWGTYTQNVWHKIDSHFLRCLADRNFNLLAESKRRSLIKVIQRNIRRGDYTMNRSRLETMRRTFHTLRTMKILTQ